MFEDIHCAGGSTPGFRERNLCHWPLWMGEQLNLGGEKEGGT